MNEALKKSLIQLGIMVLLVLLMVWAGFHPDFIENIYFNGFYRPLSVCLRFISSLFPFAFGDLLYGLLIGGTAYLIFKLSRGVWQKKIPIGVVPIKLLNFLLLLFITFKLVWGLNYDRPPIARQLQIDDQKYTDEELVALGNYFLVKLNTIKPVIDRTSARPHAFPLSNLRENAVNTYNYLSKINPVFYYPVPTVKSCLLSDWITKSGIEGYYNPLSGEANVNMQLPPFVLPFTISHEIAHQTGIAKEDEANLIGYLVCINSENINFRYAGYYNMFRSILFELRFKSPEDYELMVSQMSDSVRKDFEAENQFWRRHNSDMSKYMGAAFDQMLKFNKQRKGIKSYQDIVLWLYNFHKDEL